MNKIKNILIYSVLSFSFLAQAENLSGRVEEQLYDLKYDPFVAYRSLMKELETFNAENMRCLDLNYDFDKDRSFSIYNLDILRRCDVDKLCKPFDTASQLSDDKGSFVTHQQLMMDHKATGCLVEKSFPGGRPVELSTIFKGSEKEKDYDLFVNDVSDFMDNGNDEADYAEDLDTFLERVNKIPSFKNNWQKFEKEHLYHTFRKNIGLDKITLGTKSLKIMLEKSPYFLKYYEYQDEGLELIRLKEDQINRKFRSKFLKVKSSIKDIVKKKYGSHPKLNVVLDRIDKVKYSQFDLLNPKHSCEIPNAFFDPVDHAITICPQYIRMAEESLEEVIAHEIGHSIDPCALELSTDDTGKFFGGVYKRTHEFPGLKESDSPFKEVNSCYDSFLGINQHQGFESALIESLLESNPKMKESEAKEFANSHPHCHIGSQSGENFSDWIAAEHVASEAEKLPKNERRAFIFKSMSLFVGMYCKKYTPYQSEYIAKLQDKIKECYIDTIRLTWPSWIVDSSDWIDGKDFLHDVHAPDKDRIDYSFLSHPTIAKEFNCQQVGPYCGK